MVISVMLRHGYDKTYFGDHLCRWFAGTIIPPSVVVVILSPIAGGVGNLFVGIMFRFNFGGPLHRLYSSSMFDLADDGPSVDNGESYGSIGSQAGGV